MVYRSTHHHAVTYHENEIVLWQLERCVITKGGHLFGSVDMLRPSDGTVIQFGPYDLVWPEKIFREETA